jgi:preprotein translocase subunit SecF
MASKEQQARFFELLRPGLSIDFIGLRSTMFVVSGVLVALSLTLMVTRGVNYGIDFAGGTMMQLRFPEETAIGDLRTSLTKGGLQGVTVQDLGGDHHEFQIRVVTEDDDATARSGTAIRTALTERFGEGSYDVLRVESVGPKVGGDLWRDATLAVIAATLMMGIYLAVRFDFRFGLGAALALVHDVTITLGALALSGMEFDLTSVAALLTVVGFSVNDTVVISDRIRENTLKRRRDALRDVVNASINETLSRTLITSGTAIFVIVALFVLGGHVIHSFAFTLLVGFVVGTYSSIYVAAPVVLLLEERAARPRRRARAA